MKRTDVYIYVIIEWMKMNYDCVGKIPKIDGVSHFVIISGLPLYKKKDKTNLNSYFSRCGFDADLYYTVFYKVLC